MCHNAGEQWVVVEHGWGARVIYRLGHAAMLAPVYSSHSEFTVIYRLGHAAAAGCRVYSSQKERSIAVLLLLQVGVGLVVPLLCQQRAGFDLSTDLM